MTTITREEQKQVLIDTANHIINRNNTSPYSENLRELARIALASIEAEPVAWKWRLTSLFDGVQIGPWRVCLAPLSPGKGDGCKTEAIPLYTAPPVPVVPAALPENDDEDGHDIDYLEPSEVYALGRTSGWNACRAAMLHSAEPVSQAYKLNALAGNYPVTPDGWISCSERMPDKLIPVMVMYEDGEMWSAMWNGNRWDDGTEYPDPHSVTHWREMPAAPQQEVK